MEGVTDMPMVPLSWLSDHVDVPEGTDAQALAAALVKVGPGRRRDTPGARHRARSLWVAF